MNDLFCDRNVMRYWRMMEDSYATCTCMYFRNHKFQKEDWSDDDVVDKVSGI